MNLTDAHLAVLRGEKVPNGSPPSVTIAYIRAGFDLLGAGYLRAQESGGTQVTVYGRMALENHELRAKVAALEERMRKLSEWLPVGMAPKDGTLIVAELAYGRYEVLTLANPSPEEWAAPENEHGPFYVPAEIRRFVSLPLPSEEGGDS